MLECFVCSATPIDSDERTKHAYRMAAMKLHPDRDGDEAEFRRLQEAKEALGL